MQPAGCEWSTVNLARCIRRPNEPTEGSRSFARGDAVGRRGAEFADRFDSHRRRPGPCQTGRTGATCAVSGSQTECPNRWLDEAPGTPRGARRSRPAGGAEPVAEPFGLVGPEAGRFGVPAAAFDVGGISEWLHDGVNGQLAPGNPPTARGLADAIVRCLRDPVRYAKLRKGALETSLRFDMRRHIESLLGIFGQVAEPELPQGSELCRLSL